MRGRLSLFVSILAAALMVSSAALAFELLNPPRRWFPEDLPKDVIVDERGLATVTALDPDGGVTAAKDAVTEWNMAPGGKNINILSSSEGPPNVEVGDSLSHLVFDDPFKICKGMCIAATTVGFYDDEQTGTCGGLDVVRITDSDIFFNTSHPLITFTSEDEDPSAGDTCAGEIYVEAVVTHEVGHLIGLGHSDVDAALMAPTIGTCDNKPLHEDDTAGRDVLYDCEFVAGGGAVCGDGVCDAGEDQCNCSADCGDPPADETDLCTDGVDNDCDGAVDCADADCSADPACAEPVCGDLKLKGESCDSDSECCSGKCRGKPGAKTCK